MLGRVKRHVSRLLREPPRLIFDTRKRLGNFARNDVSYDVNLLKEELSRKYILGMPGEKLKFLDVGGKDGELRYLLGISRNLEFDAGIYAESLATFQRKFEYFGLDLNPAQEKNLIVGDICLADFSDRHPTFREAFDVIYSNNVFEHLKRPWIAARNLSLMAKPGGLIVTIVPFAQRYHEDPQDYFRYTHRGIVSLFEDCASFEVLVAGYDIAGRRNNWQGGGNNNDLVPVDDFGAWRETWFTVSVLRKLAPSAGKDSA